MKHTRFWTYYALRYSFPACCLVRFVVFFTKKLNICFNLIENNNQNFTADREGALSNIDGIKVVYLKEYQWRSRLQEMMRTLLVLALYIMHFTEAHEEHDNLTNQDLKTLKIEYFLQQFAEQIEKAPKNYIEKSICRQSN